MITKTDLQDQIETPKSRPVLFCEVCGTIYSANKGDYFQLPDNYVFECDGKPMVLAVERKVMDIVKR